MKRILELSIFQLLSEYTQHKASVAELTDAINDCLFSRNKYSRTGLCSPITFLFNGIKQAQIVSYAIWAKGKYPLRNLLMKQ